MKSNLSNQLSLRETCDGLASRCFSAEDIVTHAIAAIDNPLGQSGVAFLDIYRAQAIEQACYWDQLRSAGTPCPPLAGVPVSIKDCIDAKGLVTRAGSHALDTAAPALQDAGIVATLKKYGAIIIGRTNMSEFAYSALGTNSHFGTPLSHVSTKRIAGGSSSGAAVSIAEGMATAAIGTDTSGSARIPAAFCGISGFRPSQGRYPIDGVIPLAPSFDVVGTLARTADCLSYLDCVLRGESRFCEAQEDMAGVHFLIPDEALEGLDAVVSRAFELFLDTLEHKGARLERRSVPNLINLRQCVSDSGIVGAEGLAWHKNLLSERQESYDPRVAMRLIDARRYTAADYLRGLAEIRRLRSDIDSTLGCFAGMLMPTIPILAPRLDDISDDETFLRINAMVLRNTAIANHLDLPSVTFPINGSSKPGVGGMLIGLRAQDRLTLRHCAALGTMRSRDCTNC